MTPGVVAGFSRIGLVEVDAVDATNDIQASTSPFSAAIDVAPAINPEASAIAVSRAAGVTRAVVSPATARSIFAGQGAVIDLGGDMQPITRARAFQYHRAGRGGRRRRRRQPRLGACAAAQRAAGGARPAPADRRARRRARAANTAPPEDLAENPYLLPGTQRSDDVLLTRFDAAALVPVLQGRQLLLVHVERASDILQVLALKREFPNLRIVLVGATEGWRVAAQIAAARVPVIANALNDLPASFEQLAATQSNVGRMRAAGINVAIGMINDDEARQVRLSTQYAGNLVALEPDSRRDRPELEPGLRRDQLGAGRSARAWAARSARSGPAGAATW